MKSPRFPDVVGADRLSRALAAGQDVRLLDVRTSIEFAMGRLAGSRNVPLDRLTAHAAALARAGAPVVIVCRSGARARTAVQILKAQGMRRVHVLDGGLIAWRGHGLPVARDPVSPGALLRRAMGVFGIVLAAFSLRQNPVFAVVLGFLGFRMMTGQSALPCAIAGTCAVPDTASSVQALVEPRLETRD